MILRRRRIDRRARRPAMPAAQRMPAMMSLSVPPHLPSTRTGRISVFQPVPAMPSALFVSAADQAGDARAVPRAVDAGRLACTSLNGGCVRLRARHPVARIARRPRRGRRRRSRTARWKRSRSRRSSLPACATRSRSGCSKRTPVSSTATTVALLPTVTSHACSARVAADLRRSGSTTDPRSSGSPGTACALAALIGDCVLDVRDRPPGARAERSASLAPSARSSSSTSVSIGDLLLALRAAVPADAPSFCARTPAAAAVAGGSVAPLHDDLSRRRLHAGSAHGAVVLARLAERAGAAQMSSANPQQSRSDSSHRPSHDAVGPETVARA